MDKTVTIWNDNLSSNNYKMFFDEVEESKPDSIILNKKEDDKNKPIEKWNFEVVDKVYIDTADDSLQEQIDENKEKISDLENAVDDLETEVKKHEIRLDSLDDEVYSINEKTENLKDTSDDHEVRIGTLETSVTDLENEIDSGLMETDLIIQKGTDKSIIFRDSNGTEIGRIRISSSGSMIFSVNNKIIYLRPSGDTSTTGEVSVDNNVMIAKNVRVTTDLRVLNDGYITKNLTVDGNLTVAGTTISSLISRIEALEAQI